MKRLLFLFVVVFACKLSAQTFAVRNANDDYVVTNLKGSEKYKNNIKEVIRDRSGLYWFQNLTSISSFDGVNWKEYTLKDVSGRNVPIRINEIEVTDDSTVWLATTEGLYGFNRRSEKFMPMKEIFPQLSKLPPVTNCIYKSINDFLLISLLKDGFYIFNWSTGVLKYVAIDSVNKVSVATKNNDLDVTKDQSGNYWGLTRENKGIWFYNTSTGQIKCSWRGEILPQVGRRLQGRQIKSLVYSAKDNALLFSYGTEGILEKLFLSTGKSVFYSFLGNLSVRADTNATDRYPIIRVKIDRNGDEWVLIAQKYLVMLNADISKMKYLEYDPDLLPLGKMNWLLPQADLSGTNSTDEILLWISGEKGLSVLKRKNTLVKQIRYEEHSIGGITPADYLNRDGKLDIPFQNMFFVKGGNDEYLLFQQNPGRPKIIRFDRNLKITGSLFNDQWKSYPAYFNPHINAEKIYVAILRQGEEPMDFRQVVIKDFSVDLSNMKATEQSLSFPERVWRYGVADENGVCWLFSNGYLYSFDPQKRFLDSLFICAPGSKGKYPLSRIKGYDFPTLLHKKSSTFWISFISNRELYKVNLAKRKIEKIFRGCIDNRNCLPGSVYQLNCFDTSRIYLKLNFSAALLNPFNDSVTIYSDLFRSRLPEDDYVGSCVYKDWLCNVTSTEINLVNITSGRQKRLSLDQDFKWPVSVASSPLLVNDKSEMILMSSSQKGFVVFNLDSVLYPPPPGKVRVAYLKVDGRFLPLDSILQLGALRIKYNQYSSIHLRFSDYTLTGQDQIKYEYSLYNGGDTLWNRVEGEPDLTFTKISPGNYKLLLRASNGFGEYSPEVSVLNISIIPPFTQTIWFVLLLVVIAAVILYGVYRYRMKQVKRVQIIRNNIASDLHDDIGSTLNSISIYSEVARQQAGKELPALELIGQNSRKIIDSMSDIVWTINPENDSFEKIITRMRSFAYNILKAKQVEYSFEVDEKLNAIQLPMQVRKNFYLIFKEAVNNLVKYSKASTAIISLYERNRTIVLSIYDNGIGIPDDPDYQGNGLLNMKRRAAEIKADLVIESDNGDGTKIEVRLKS
jgi:two-component sensor histidine kinase